MFDLTIYTLAAALVLIAWALCRVLPRIPDSGGMQGLNFWLALVLVVDFDRVLNIAYFTVQTTLYDQYDALWSLGLAALLFHLTSLVLKQPKTI